MTGSAVVGNAPRQQARDTGPAVAGGRANPDNAVRVYPVVADRVAQAVLRIPVHHASLVDHPQDHLPGRVIVEGARQLALVAAQDVQGLAATKTFVTDMDVCFTPCGELDEDTVFTAWGDAVADPAATAGAVPLYSLGGISHTEEEPSQPPAVRVEASQKNQPLGVFSFALAWMTA
ncbi:AfsA-related hotdog domain-containing protein [Streptomyces sp. NPDC048384]|uniref:AfsA-related hotdog domain-containing protein n=1 Tax=Streptomyces sp. NPDC048384 TaxID=3155487 RepID=UPI0034457F0D